MNVSCTVLKKKQLRYNESEFTVKPTWINKSKPNNNTI